MFVRRCDHIAQFDAFSTRILDLKVFGDDSIMREGKEVMTFENVKDPQGVKQLIEALKRESIPWNQKLVSRAVSHLNES